MKKLILYTFLLFLFVILPFSANGCKDSEKKNFLISESDWEYSSSNSPFSWSPILSPLIKDPIKLKGNYFLRCKFLSPSNLNLSLLLLIPPIIGHDKVYLNGIKIGETGDFETNSPFEYDRVRLYEVRNELLSSSGTNHLVFELKSIFEDEIALIKSPIQIGEIKTIYSTFLFKEFSYIALILIFIFSGLNFFYLYIRDSNYNEYLIYFFFILDISLYLFMGSQFKYHIHLDFIYLKKIEYISLTLSLPIFFHFLFEFNSLKNDYPPSKNKYFYISGLILSFLDFLLVCSSIFYLNSDIISHLNIINKIIVHPVFLIYIFIGVLRFWFINKSIDDYISNILFYSLLFLSMSVINDIFTDRNYIRTPKIFGFSFLIFLICLHIFLLEKFNSTKNNWKHLSERLEVEVGLRTNRLKDSLNEVLKIKTSQESDYFLFFQTMENFNHIINSGNKNISIFSKPYFEFEFRGVKKRVGGDICISENLFINDDEYLFIMNSDAMGKSLQGAIGALVIGIITKNFLSENKKSISTTPEKWLFNLFMNLQKSFECFEETMFASSCMALVNIKKGVYYQVNSDHPKTILYRNNEATFLNSVTDTNKLGVSIIPNQFKVSTFILEHEDIIIIGSDGKDELIMKDKNENPYYNLDENLFLKIVEQSSGDVDKMILNLDSTGIVRDDLSIITFKYTNFDFGKEIDKFFQDSSNNYKFKIYKDSPDILFLEDVYKVFPESSYLNKYLGFYYYRFRKFEKATNYFRIYNSLYSDSIDLLYIETVLNKKLGNFLDAKIPAEKIFLRNPEHKKNLINLLHIYNELGEFENKIIVQKKLDTYKNEIY